MKYYVKSRNCNHQVTRALRAGEYETPNSSNRVEDCGDFDQWTLGQAQLTLAKGTPNNSEGAYLERAARAVIARHDAGY